MSNFDIYEIFDFPDNKIKLLEKKMKYLFLPFFVSFIITLVSGWQKIHRILKMA